MPVHSSSSRITSQAPSSLRCGRPFAPRNARKARRAQSENSAEQAMRYWLDVFHSFHTDGVTYSPFALKTVEQSATNRFVYEVALRRDARGATWVFIVWEVDVPGIQFCDCADRDEAMVLLADPSKAAGRWHGVRLRPESRPW